MDTTHVSECITKGALSSERKWRNRAVLSLLPQHEFPVSFHEELRGGARNSSGSLLQSLFSFSVNISVNVRTLYLLYLKEFSISGNLTQSNQGFRAQIIIENC